MPEAKNFQLCNCIGNDQILHNSLSFIPPWGVIKWYLWMANETTRELSIQCLHGWSWAGQRWMRNCFCSVYSVGLQLMQTECLLRTTVLQISRCSDPYHEGLTMFAINPFFTSKPHKSSWITAGFQSVSAHWQYQINFINRIMGTFTQKLNVPFMGRNVIFKGIFL